MRDYGVRTVRRCWFKSPARGLAWIVWRESQVYSRLLARLDRHAEDAVLGRTLTFPLLSHKATQ